MSLSNTSGAGCEETRTSSSKREKLMRVCHFDSTKLISEPYKYGFTTDVEIEDFPKGLSPHVIKLISAKKSEPEFMLDFRLRAYEYWKKLVAPDWACVNYLDINYQNILYYSAPKENKKLTSLDEVDPNILDTFEKLGIPLTEQKRLANVAVDAIFYLNDKPFPRS